MAVYTKLTQQDIESHLENYDIGNLVEYKEILAGIDNSNFIIKTDRANFILTIFEARIDPKDLPYFIGLKLHLAQHNICCPEPMRTNSGEVIAKLKGKNSAIVSFLQGAMLETRKDGYYDTITANHCFEVGAVTAKMQLAAQDFALKRYNDLSCLDFAKFLAKFSDFMLQDKDFRFPFTKGEGEGSLLAEIKAVLSSLEANWRQDLTSGPCHLDLFPDNVFFNGEKLSGVIDFYFAANDLFIYDFAVIVNAWCFDEDNNFDFEKLRAMKAGYQQYRKFTDQEGSFLKIALTAASLRFLLTRLHDMFMTPEDSFVTVKDPREYLEKMRFFVNLNEQGLND